MRVLVVNAGSSSLKLTLLDGDDDDARRTRARRAARAGRRRTSCARALDAALARGRRGRPPRSSTAASASATPVRIDADVEHGAARADRRSRRCTSRSRWPRSTPSPRRCRALPAVACFDTAFHATLPAAAATYALPAAVARALGAAPLRLPRPLARLGRAARAASCSGATRRRLRIVSCHLGAGASLCAIARRALGRHDDGLHAARGAGDGDPLGQRRPGPAAVAARARAGCRARGARATRSSTTPGCSGSPARADMREVLDARRRRRRRRRGSRSRSTLHRLRAGIAAMAAALGGLDALVFTGGVGEHSAPVRARAAERARLPRRRDRRRAQRRRARRRRYLSRRIQVRTLVIEAREDLEIARQVRATLSRHCAIGRYPVWFALCRPSCRSGRTPRGVAARSCREQKIFRQRRKHGAFPNKITV